MIRDIAQHLDWLGMVLSLISYAMLARHRRRALWLLAISNVVWGTWAVTRQVLSISLLNLAYLILNIRTLLIWRRNGNEVSSREATE